MMLNFMDDVIQDVRLEALPENKELSGPEPDREFLKSIEKFGVIYPIVLCQNEEDVVVIDGRRRIKAARALGHDTIKAITYFGLHPEDVTTWGVVLNEQRSVNIIQEYHAYVELIKEDNWDELREAYGFNKSHVQKVLSLGKIEELNKIVEAYEKGKIAESTMFAMAKLDPERQKHLLKVLRTEGKLTGSDIKEAKRLKQLEAIASMPKFEVVENVEQMETTEPKFFAVWQPGTNTASLYDTIHSALNAKRAHGPGAKVYKLFEV